MARPRTKNKHLPKYVTERHGAYWYGPPKVKAVRVCDKADMAALYKFMLSRAEPEGPVTTLGDCFDRYLREHVPTLQARTQKDYQKYIEKLRAWCGHRLPQELEPREIGRFLDAPKGRIHRNKMVSVLNHVYTKIIGRWYVPGCTVNPCENVERNHSKKRERYITDAEFDVAYRAMNARMRIAMDLALITGQRQGDLLALRWESVTKEGIYFQQGKTGKRLIVALSPALEDVLTRARQLVPQLPREYVLRTRKGKAYSSPGFRAIWQRVMRRLCKKGKNDEPPALAARFTFHDIRAKAVSDSKTLEEAFARAGHTSMSMTRGTYDRGIRVVTPLK